MMTEKTPDLPHPGKTAEGRLPGDPTRARIVDEMIRVDHAGEYGAVRIYAGQLAVLGRRHRLSPVVRHMEQQEARHLKKFDSLLLDHKVRPTALGPLWHAAGFALGAATALMGEKAAMACTAAVEEVIEEHYSAQLQKLGDDDKGLRDTIADFRADEVEHKTRAIKEGAMEAPGYSLLSGAIKTGCRAAIWLSKRI